MYIAIYKIVEGKIKTLIKEYKEEFIMINIGLILYGGVLLFLIGMAIHSNIELNRRNKEYNEWKEKRDKEVKEFCDNRLEKVNKIYNEVEEINKECKARMEDESFKEEYKEFMDNSNNFIEYMEKEYK